MAVAIVLAQILVAPASFAADQSGNAPTKSLLDTYNGYPWLRDFELAEYGLNGLIANVKADSMRIRPRKLWFFNIRSFNEVYISNARIHATVSQATAADGNDDTSAGSGDGDTSTLGMEMISPESLSNRPGTGENLGLITRTIVDKINVCVGSYESPDVCLSAESAEINERGLIPEFRNATLEKRTENIRFFSRKILWDAHQEVFLIPGDYTVQSADGIASGNAVKVTLEFEVVPL